ncbi:proline dehydrogenase family protein [Algoriphagus sp. C2-6-M1]|uniref:proline dehydrogenase family protein n=1 Tax=Algoriphagus persicinus TaxID=3108754 RepID=UPI002B3E8EE2|nr:proline dehydrogenase family protein [Algoriphagus sp. C2-6-M1]MEB2782805.1 proline dehydrogenase family protein [Algoriphagus sp. C2-6-M1]
MPANPTISFENMKVAFASKSNAELRKMRLVFAMLNNKFVSDLGIALATIAFKLHLPIKGIMKRTMFGHFCGGETIAESTEAAQKLAKYGVESTLDYSVEGDGDEGSYDNTCTEILKTIEKAENQSSLPFAVFKVTGLGNYQIMTKVQAKETLSKEESLAFERMKSRVDQLCHAAFQNGIKILVDAEESWFQDVIDELAYEAMEKYNRKTCVVYNTYQMYRHDMMARLKAAEEESKSKGYLLGAKLVRGAYMEKEADRAEEMGYPSPIQPNKAATDKDYNLGVEFCIANDVYLVSGSHNEASNHLVAELIEKHGIDKDSDRVFFAQLYGMSDNISFNLADAGYRVLKYVPYGPVEKVMPYLIRRASENSSIAGQSSREFSMIKRELERRKKSRQ